MSRFRPAGFRKWADRMAARLATRWRAACTAAEHRISRGWTAWRRPHGTPLRLETRSHHGRRAPRGAPLHGGGSAKSVARCLARCSRTGSSNPSPSSRESVSLPISTSIPRKARFSAGLGTMPGGRVGRDAQSHYTEPRSDSVSFELYSSTAVLPDAAREIGGAGCKRRRSP